MKNKILLTVIFLIGFMSAYAQDEDPFAQFMDMKGVSVVYISKSMLNMMPNMKMNGIDVGGAKGKLKSVTIISAETKQVIVVLRKEANRVIKTKKYEQTMFVKDDDSKTVFYIKNTNETKDNDFIMITEEPDELTIIRIQGDLSMQDLKSNKK